MNARWKHPFTYVVAGPKECCKTTFVTRLLRHASMMIEASPEKTMWSYSEWQSTYAKMNLANLHFEEGLPNASLFDPKSKNLVTIDDLKVETENRHFGSS